VRTKGRFGPLAASLLICAAGADACSSSLEGVDSGPSSDDAPPGSLDATEGCSAGHGSTSGKLVRVVYLVPSDRTPDPRYTANLEASVRALQLWVRGQMPRGTGFRIHDPAVEVIQTSHPEAFYRTNDTGDGDLVFWANVHDEAFALMDTTWDDPENVWMFYIDADEACGQRGGAAVAHVAVAPKNDLRGLVGEPRVPPCGDASDGYGRCRWVGGMGMLLFYALGVPDPVECTDTNPDTMCDDALLSWLGYYGFPDAHVNEAQADYLADSGFVDAVGLPDCQLDCAIVSLP
jgi:hypothetical protein